MAVCSGSVLPIITFYCEERTWEIDTQLSRALALFRPKWVDYISGMLVILFIWHVSTEE